MQGDAALSKPVLDGIFPGSRLTTEANLLIMPGVDAANIAYNLLKVAAGHGITIGPILLGAAKPVHILEPGVSVRRIVNMTALADVDAERRAPAGREQFAVHPGVIEGNYAEQFFQLGHSPMSSTLDPMLLRGDHRARRPDHCAFSAGAGVARVSDPAAARGAAPAPLGAAVRSVRPTTRGARWRTSSPAIPTQFHERHYSEFVTFLPPVQRFLYGEGLSKIAAPQGVGEPHQGDAAHRHRAHQGRAGAGCGARSSSRSRTSTSTSSSRSTSRCWRSRCSPTMCRSTVAQEIMFKLGRAYPAYLGERSGRPLPLACRVAVGERRGAGGIGLSGARQVPRRSPASIARRGSPRTGSICCSRWCRTTRTRRARCAIASSSTTACRSWPISRSTGRRS